MSTADQVEAALAQLRAAQARSAAALEAERPRVQAELDAMVARAAEELRRPVRPLFGEWDLLAVREEEELYDYMRDVRAHDRPMRLKRSLAQLRRTRKLL